MLKRLIWLVPVFLLGGLFVFATGIASSRTSAGVVLRDGYMTKDIYQTLIPAFERKAAELGADCVSRWENTAFTCRTTRGNPTYDFTIRRRRDGEDVIVIEATRGHFPPPSAQDVKAGRFVTDTQKALEAWMTDLVPKEQIARRWTSYGETARD